MKKIEAIIRPKQIDAVKEALINAGITGMTISNAKGSGRQKGYTEMYRGHEFSIQFLDKIRIEVVVQDEKLQLGIDAIMTASRTGEIGDGKIFIQPIEEVIRIRTGERGTDAL